MPLDALVPADVPDRGSECLGARVRSYGRRRPTRGPGRGGRGRSDGQQIRPGIRGAGADQEIRHGRAGHHEHGAPGRRGMRAADSLASTER